MVTFVFWNLMGNEAATWARRAPNLRTRIARIASHHGVDLFLFAESAFTQEELTDALNSAAASSWPAWACAEPSR